jgi:hypothetical protein
MKKNENARLGAIHCTGAAAAAANDNDEVAREIDAVAVAKDLAGSIIPNIRDASFRL